MNDIHKDPSSVKLHGKFRSVNLTLSELNEYSYLCYVDVMWNHYFIVKLTPIKVL